MATLAIPLLSRLHSKKLRRRFDEEESWKAEFSPSNTLLLRYRLGLVYHHYGHEERSENLVFATDVVSTNAFVLAGADLHAADQRS